MVNVNKKIRLNLPGYYDKKGQELWSCEVGQNTIGLPINRVTNFGVLEYWSIGVLEKAKPRI